MTKLGCCRECVPVEFLVGLVLAIGAYFSSILQEMNSSTFLYLILFIQVEGFY